MPFFLLLHLDLLPLASGLPSRGLGAELTTLLGSPSPAPVVVSLGLRVSCAHGSCAPSSEALLVLPQLFLTMNIFRERLPYPHLRGVCVWGGGGLCRWFGGMEGGFFGRCLPTRLFAQCPASAPAGASGFVCCQLPPSPPPPQTLSRPPFASPKTY